MRVRVYVAWLTGLLYTTHAALEFLAACICSPFSLYFAAAVYYYYYYTYTYVCGEYSVLSIDTRLFIEEEQLSLSLYTRRIVI